MREYTITMKFRYETTGDNFNITVWADTRKEAIQSAKEENPACTVICAR